jgi:hypothetical protein
MRRPGRPQSGLTRRVKQAIADVECPSPVSPRFRYASKSGPLCRLVLAALSEAQEPPAVQTRTHRYEPLPSLSEQLPRSRLKWTQDNAGAMLALHITRANGQWWGNLRHAA